MLIEHRLDFSKDWLRANESFRMGRIDAQGRIAVDQYTPTGHLDNHFSIGPAILWAPFLIAAHIGVVAYDGLGGHVMADGYSRPYLVAMALGTAACGFLALLISFRLARKFASERWAFLATLGIWFGSSLPVYMYFNPSWSHAQSAFVVALFVWYWHRTREERTWMQWALLGAIGGLMLDVYYLNVILLLLPAFDSLVGYWKSLRGPEARQASRLLCGNVAFGVAAFALFLPTLITRKVIYGAYFRTGYEHLWTWNSPFLLRVGFSADHGLFSWTPMLILSVIGLLSLWPYDRALSAYLVVVFAAFLYVIGCYADWDGLSSFGNRFFVSLTPVFILGLAALFDRLARALMERRAALHAWTGTAVLVLWNLGLVYQWGTHLIPPRGPISWRAAAYNQVAVVPVDAARTLQGYFTHRNALMNRIEQTDVDQIKSQQSGGADTPQ